MAVGWMSLVVAASSLDCSWCQVGDTNTSTSTIGDTIGTVGTIGDTIRDTIDAVILISYSQLLLQGRRLTKKH